MSETNDGFYPALLLLLSILSVVYLHSRYKLLLSVHIKEKRMGQSSFKARRSNKISAMKIRRVRRAKDTIDELVATTTSLKRASVTENASNRRCCSEPHTTLLRMFQ
jgi:hypothetical protein